MSSFGVEFNNSLRSPHFKWIEVCHLISVTSCTVGPILGNKKGLQLVALMRCLRRPHVRLFFRLFGAGTAIRIIHDGLSSHF